MAEHRELVPFDIDLVFRLLTATVLSWPFGGFLVGLLKVAGWDVTMPAHFRWACAYAALLFAAHFARCKLAQPKKKADWDTEIVVITGASSGVGALVAETLATRNVTVINLDVQKPDTYLPNIAYYECDVSNKKAVDEVAAKIRAEIGHPTMLVNNAGIVRPGMILEMTEKDVHANIDVNLKAHFWTIQAFLPHMLECNHGHIVTIASALGLSGTASVAGYAAAKAGLIMMHDALRSEILSRYKKPCVQTTLFCTGKIGTDMFAGVNHACPFITPVLEPLTVAKEIIDALDNGQSREVLMPLYTNVAPLLRLMPRKVNDWLHEVSGASTEMRNWCGDKVKKKLCDS